MEEQTVTVHDPPAVTLDGEDCNATGTAYTVCFTISGGDNSCYMVTPNTGTLTGNQFCSDPINSGDGYSFEVTDCHNCPAVTISSLEVSCDCATQAGDIEPAPLSVCSDEMTPALNVSGNQFLDPDDALCFVLFSGSVALAVNPDESVFGFNPGNMVPGEVYQICPVAGNDDGSGCVDFSDPCLNIGGCVDVVFSPLPTAILDGTADVCLGEDPELEVELTGTGPWELTYQNSAGDVFVETVPTSPYILDVIPTVSTIISLTNVADANGCTNTITGNTATVNILQPPGFTNLVEDCNALETEFTVSFTITGGDPNTYMVDPPGTIVGNVFTSDPIPTNSNYTFLLDDGNGCGPTVISDGHACNCLTSVGTMQGGSLTLCEGDLTPASIYDSANEVLDPDDVRLFVLLSINSPIFNPANVIAVNPVEPVFGFDAATMSYGTTYYIAAVVGNNDGAGGIAPMDLCLAFSNFSIVRFFPLPTVSVSAPSAICDGDQATIEFTLTGTPPYDIIYTVNGLQDQLTGVVPMGSVFTADLPLATTTTITLVSITDANGCSNTASGSVTIEVNPLVEAGTATGTLDFCEGSNQTIELSNQLSGATPGGTWTTTSGQVIPTGSINVGTLPVGVNTLTYTVSGTPPCPDDVAEVLINITEAPVADAGPDLQLNCDITSVQLNPGNTTPGATITWTGSGITLPSDPNPVVTVPGIYTLTASIGNCTDVDEMVVELNVTTPQLYVAANPVSCFGETDGFVVVDSVSGGEPPYLFSLNNGPFTAQQSFLNLAPGSHTLTVEDNAGCMTTETFEIPEPEEVTVTLSATYPDPDIAPAVPLGESVTITASTTGGVDTIIWSPPGVDSLCVGCTQITFTPTQQTAISAVVDGNGCSDEDLLTVFINKERPVFVPNAFSPNDDLINDRLHIFGGKSAVVVKSFLIFNRWGELVFEFYNFPPAPLDYSVGWDGKYRGEYLNPGVFVWYAEIEFTDGSTGVYEGDVTLIR
ncbi:MAG TPA: hypothetical protein ENJ20_04140 [Bacteroidetes bacterium]|nr:hypothetical protein [Bacteroidota bacterium]